MTIHVYYIISFHIEDEKKLIWIIIIIYEA